ncbi:MAG: pilus assembly protein N-terminal domain-containing protein [Caulobacterales bacterium]|jgi:Flp pilus assembly secretin CpaC
MRVLALLIAVAAVGFAPALADGGGPAAPRVQRAAAVPASTLQIPIDTAQPIRLSSAARGVVVGNPSIVGVSVQSDHLLFMTGRSYGSTSVTVVGEDGVTLYNARVTVIPDERDSVVVTRGAESTRLICTPVCRPNPDIGDSNTTFTQATGQANSRSQTARSGGQ